MTSIKGKGTFAALAVCAALLVPTAAATAGDSYSTSAIGGSAHARAPFSVSFIRLTRDGKTVAVKKFKFSGVNAECKVGGAIEVHGRAPRMKVRDRKFKSTIRKNGGRVRINGKFKNHGKKVKGRIRVNGKFNDGKAKGCVGVRPFRASQK